MLEETQHVNIQSEVAKKKKKKEIILKSAPACTWNFISN